MGVAAVSGLAFLLSRGCLWIQKGYLQLAEMSNLRLKGLLFGLGAGLDPGGPLNRAAISAATDPGMMAALTAGGLALSLGLSVYCVIYRKRLDKVHCANGWTALPAGLCGAVKGYLVFFAGDPFRVAASAACGSSAAGLLQCLWGALQRKRDLSELFFVPIPLAFGSLFFAAQGFAAPCFACFHSIKDGHMKYKKYFLKFDFKIKIYPQVAKI